MTTAKKHFNVKRVLCLAFAVIMTAGVFTAVFLETGITAKAAIAVGDYSMVFFNVPETIYLTPGATTFQYVSDQTMDDNGGITVNQGYKAISSGANVNFYCPTATNITVSASPSISLSTSSNANGRYNATFSSGSAAAGTVITWTAQYTDSTDGKEKTAYAYSYVYGFSATEGTAAAQCFELREANSNKNREILNWAIWLSGVYGIEDLGSGYTTNDVYSNASYAYPGWVSSVNLKSGSSTDPKNSDTLDGCYVSATGNKGYHGYWWKSDSSSRDFIARWIPVIYADLSRYQNTKDMPHLKVGLDVFENWGGDGDGTTSWGLGYYVNGQTANTTNILAQTSSSGSNSSRANGRRLNTSLNLLLEDGTNTYVLSSIGTARNDGKEVKTTTYMFFRTVTVNKSSLRSTVNYAQNAGFDYNTDYTKALKDAYTVLGKPNATSSELTNADSALQSEVNKFESADSMVSFNVPETIYLKPGEDTFQYVLDQTMAADGSITVNQGYKDISKGGNINFYCPGATNIVITSTIGHNLKASDTSADRYDTTITSGSWTSTTSDYIKWTATYKKNGETYTKTAFTYVYAPITTALSGSAAGRYDSSYSNRKCYGAITLWVVGQHGFTSYGTTNDGSGAYKHQPLVSGSTVPTSSDKNWSNVFNSAVSNGGGGAYWATDDDVEKDFASGYVYIDTSRYSNYNQVPNLWVGLDNNYRYGNGTSGKYSRLGYNIVNVESATGDTDKRLWEADTGNNNNYPSEFARKQINRNIDKSKTSEQFNIRGFSEFKGSGSGSTRSSCAHVFLTANLYSKQQLRDLVAECVSVNTDTFSPEKLSAFNTAYENACKALDKVDNTSTDVTDAYNSLLKAKSGKTRSTAYGEYYDTIQNKVDESILPTVSRSFTLGDKITASAEEVTGYDYQKMEFPFDVGSFYLRSNERSGRNIASVSVNSANNTITVKSGASGTDNYTNMPSGTSDSRNLYYLEVQPGTRISLTADISGTTAQMFIFGLDSNGCWTQGMASTYSTGKQTITLDIQSGCKYVCFRFGNQTTNTTTTFSNITVTYTGDQIYLTRVQKENIRFRFHYKPKPCTVYLDGNGATSQGTESIEIYVNNPLPAISNLPTRTGYTFLGYFDSNNNQYYNAKGEGGTIWEKSGSGTLYAHWQANTYKVTFDQTGATTLGTTQITVTFDSAPYTAPATVPTRTGYTFTGYWDAASGGTKYYEANGAAVDGNLWDIPDDTTLYAQWTINQYHLDVNGVLDSSFDVSGATQTVSGVSPSGNITDFGTFDVYVNGSKTTPNPVSDYYSLHDYNSTFTLQDIKQEDGKTFDGFYLSTDNVFHTPDDTATGVIPAGNISINLFFHTNTFSINYYPNGDIEKGEMGTQTFKFGDKNTVNANAFENSHKVTFNYNFGDSTVTSKDTGSNGKDSTTVNCTFLHWATNPDGSGDIVTNSKNIGNYREETKTNDKMTYELYAIWQNNAITLPKPARLGYTFGGWYLDSSFRTPVGKGQYTPTASVTLYAKWNQVNCTNAAIAYDYEAPITTKIIADNSTLPDNGTFILASGISSLNELNKISTESYIRGTTYYIKNNTDGYIISQGNDSNGKNTEVSFTPQALSDSTLNNITAYYEYSFTENNLTQKLTGSIEFVPANSVYYEESNFITHNSIEEEYSDEYFTPSQWETIYANGNNSLVGGEKYPVYGYNISNKAYIPGSFSANTAIRAQVSQFSQVSKTVEYEFSGTGFDLYSDCGDSTSVLMVYVWNVTEGANGQKEYSPVANTAVDTYLTDSNLLTQASYPGNLLTQVPVYHFEASNFNNPNEENPEETPNYLVQVYALWVDSEPLARCSSPESRTECAAKQIEAAGLDVNEELFDIKWMDKNSVFNGGSGSEINLVPVSSAKVGARAATCYGYIDGIRVYHQCDPESERFKGGYDDLYISTEKDASFFNVKQFIRNAEVNEYKDYTAKITAYGSDPINEVYLAPDKGPAEGKPGATAFKISGFNSEVNRVMISARAVTGTPSILVRGSNKGEIGILINLVSSTEMYYDITDCLTADANGDATVYITQRNPGPGKTGGYAAIGNVKITAGSAAHTTLTSQRLVALSPAEASAALDYMSTEPASIIPYNVEGSLVSATEKAAKADPNAKPIVNPDTPDTPDKPESKAGLVNILGGKKALDVDYKTTVIFHGKLAETAAAEDGTTIMWYVNGEYAGKGDSYTLKNIKEQSVVEARLVNDKGEETGHSETVTVKPAKGFIQKLIAFFKGLFGKLPVIDLK